MNPYQPLPNPCRSLPHLRYYQFDQMSSLNELQDLLRIPPEYFRLKYQILSLDLWSLIFTDYNLPGFIKSIFNQSTLSFNSLVFQKGQNWVSCLNLILKYFCLFDPYHKERDFRPQQTENNHSYWIICLWLNRPGESPVASDWSTANIWMVVDDSLSGLSKSGGWNVRES